jgi:carbohydrate-selective porin OprB
MLRKVLAAKGAPTPLLRRAPLALLAVAACLSSAAHAQSPAKPAAPKNNAPAAQHLFGDWGGLLSDLHNKGVDLSFDYTGQVGANVAGGKKTGIDYAQQAHSRPTWIGASWLG